MPDRTEIIASYQYGDAEGFAVDRARETVAQLAAPSPAKPAPTPASDDQTILDAIKSAIALQKKDPDGEKDPNDAKVLAALEAALEAQEADVEGEASAPAPKAPAKAPAPAPVKAAPTTAAGTPTPGPEAPGKADMPTNQQAEKKGPENGDICANPDCGHTAGLHANEQDGDNEGACQSTGCSCPGFQKENEEQAQAEPAISQSSMALPGAPAPPGAAPAEGEPKTEQNQPPVIPGGENMGAPFVIPVGIIEGQETGDGRMIAAGALTWRTPPMPLMLLATNPHDPSGMSPNDPAVIAGRIDSLERAPGDGATQVISAKGFCLPNDAGAELAQLCESMGRLGVSGDVAVDATEITSVEMDSEGYPLDIDEQITAGTIMGFTACPFPAFEGAYMILGDGTGEQPAAIPQRSVEDESPEAKNTPPLAASIHFMAYEECVPCQQGYDVITAAGGPTRPPKTWFADPNFVEGDGRLVEILDKKGQGGKYACPLTVTEDGRVYGHIAPWNACHTGHMGACVTAPKSNTGYAYFKLGEIVSAEGEKVRVGKLTADVGHATTRPGVKGFTAPEAIAHYDNAALQVAYVNIGEDDYGIWVAGAVAPTATEDQVQKLRASSISGDWRGIAGKPELVAALCVNQPGFPLAVVAGGQQSALVAAGAQVMERLKHPSVVESGLPAWAEGPLLDLAAKAARERVAQLG
jgi:hypothetical protein